MIRFGKKSDERLLVLTGDVQLNAMIGLDSVDFVSIANRNILAKGVNRVFEFCNRNKVGF